MNKGKYVDLKDWNPDFVKPKRRAPECPPAYGGCTCPCHRFPGVNHVMPCCYPEDDTTPSEARLIAELKAELAESERENNQLHADLYAEHGEHADIDTCPTWHDGCNCTVANLLGVRRQLLERETQLERELSVAREEIQKARAEARRIAELEKLVAEKDAQLGKQACRRNRCVQFAEIENELAAAREEIARLEQEKRETLLVTADDIIEAATKARAEDGEIYRVLPSRRQSERKR